MSLRLEGVSYRYAGSTATVLSGVDLVVERGEVVGLVGANEAGKTTLCLVAAGLAPATIGGRLEGTVHIDDIDTAAARPFELAQRCGTLFQNPATQLSGTAPTVWEEIAFGPRNLALPLARSWRGWTRPSRRWPSATWCGAIRPASRAARRSWSRLPGSSPCGPRTSCWTSRRASWTRRARGSSVTRWRPSPTRSNAGVLIVEHKTDLLAGLASRVAVIDAGRLVADGPAGTTLADERLPGWGVQPPSAVRLARAAAAAGVPLG